MSANQAPDTTGLREAVTDPDTGIVYFPDDLGDPPPETDYRGCCKHCLPNDGPHPRDEHADPCEWCHPESLDGPILAAHPDPTPEPDAGDVKALTEALYADADLGPGYMMRDDCEHLARRFLASDWLTAHEAEVARTAAKDAGERIARCIEALPHITKFGYVPAEHVKAEAARIARGATR